MTKKKPKPAPTETATTAPDQTPSQIYDQQVQQVLDDWTTESVEDLETRIRALDMPDDRLKFNPTTSESSLRNLRNLGEWFVRSWHVPPPRPKPAEFPRPEPTQHSLERAAQRKRIEESYRSQVDVRLPWVGEVSSPSFSLQFGTATVHAN